MVSKQLSDYLQDEKNWVPFCRIEDNRLTQKETLKLPNQRIEVCSRIEIDQRKSTL